MGEFRKYRRTLVRATLRLVLEFYPRIRVGFGAFKAKAYAITFDYESGAKGPLPVFDLNPLSSSLLFF